MVREEGHYTIKRVDKLPKLGNANWLYVIKADTIDKFYRWLPNGTYEEISLVGAGGSASYVSNVALNGTDLEFTGTGLAFNSSVDLSPLTGGAITLEGYDESGTRSGGDLLLTLGDYDDSNNGTKINIDDAAEEITASSNNLIYLFGNNGGTEIGQLGLTPTNVFLRRYLAAGGPFQTHFYIGDPTASNFTVTLNAPSGIAPNTDLILPLSVNGNFADSDGDIIIAAGGDVTKVGTPVNNQIGIWTGDGTIEGDSDVTFDDSKLRVQTSSTQGVDINKVGSIDITSPNLNTDKVILQSKNAAGGVNWSFVDTQSGGLFQSTELDVQGKFNIDTNGQAIGLLDYGSGSITGTATYSLAVDTNGNIIEEALGGGGSIVNDAYGAGWNGDTTQGASRNALYDKFVSVDASISAVVVGNGAGSSPIFKTTVGGETTWQPIIGTDIPDTHQLVVNGNIMKRGIDYTFSGDTFTFTGMLPIGVGEEHEYYPHISVVGTMDTTNNSIVGDSQTATGDGTTTIDWSLGNTFDFQFGAFNEVFTFTNPSKAGTFILKLVQDGVGSRTVTFPASVKWSGGTAPTLTTTATTGTDIITFYFDGTNYFAVEVLDFS